MYRIIITFLFFSCNSDIKNETSDNNNSDSTVLSNDLLIDSSFENLIYFANNYSLNEIALDRSINDSLRKYNVEKLFVDSSNYEQARIFSYTILLKTYLGHLKVGGQSFNLRDMTNGESRYILEIFIRDYKQRHKTGNDFEYFISSSVPFSYVTESPDLLKNKNIKIVVDEIEKKEKEIIKKNRIYLNADSGL